MADINVEIFAAGVWNNLSFSEADLKDMVINFDKLKDVQQVPLKFGHNDEQPMTDGQPAFGWVDKVWLVGTKLMAKFTDVPDIVAKAFAKKLYRNVSVELLFDVEYKGNKFINVLDAVALLGADAPAVNVLADLNSYMSRNSLEADRHACFSSVKGNRFKKEDPDMDKVEELQKQVDGLTKERDDAIGKAATFKVENDKLVKEADDKKKADFAVEAEKKRAKVKEVFEAAVKAQNILPAQREAQFKLLGVDDDDLVMKIDLEVVTAAFGVEAAANFSKEKGKQNTSESERTHEDAGDELTGRAKVAMTANKDLTFGEAFEAELVKDEDLAKEYHAAIVGGDN